jgi:hypothetical protein
MNSFYICQRVTRGSTNGKLAITRREEMKHYTRIPTLINMTSCREVKGREIIRERDQERNIQYHVDRGRHIDRGSYPISHDVKGRERERSEE